MKKILSSVVMGLAFISMVGCSSVPKEPAKFVQLTDVQKIVKDGVVYSKKSYASGIPWNSEYVVTAKHVDFAKNSVFKAPGKIDLQFLKQNDSNVVKPQWRDRQPEEAITIIGLDKTGKTHTVSGKDLNVSTQDGNSINYITSAITVGGQSGGPVFGQDGKVIGMLVGISNGKNASGKMDSSLAGKGSEFSLYIPYAVIQEEWNTFQKNK